MRLKKRYAFIKIKETKLLIKKLPNNLILLRICHLSCCLD